MTLGVAVDSFGMELRAGLEQAAKFAARCVQLEPSAVLSPKVMGQTARRDFRTVLRGYNLDFAALAIPLRHGLDVFENQQPRLDQIKEFMQFAFDLGTRVVVVPFPKLPAAPVESDAPAPSLFLINRPPNPADTLRASLTELGRAADRTGVTVAFEVGQDAGQAVAEYLNSYDVERFGMALDPASFLLNRQDPFAAVMALYKRLVHVMARDARTSSASGPTEVPVGAGDLDWMTWLASLATVEYTGCVCVKQNVGDNRAATMGQSLAFLRRFLPAEQPG